MAPFEKAFTASKLALSFIPNPTKNGFFNCMDFNLSRQTATLEKSLSVPVVADELTAYKNPELKLSNFLNLVSGVSGVTKKIKSKPLACMIVPQACSNSYKGISGKINPSTPIDFAFLQKCKIAGRVELFNGVQKVEERLVSTDVCSLYPYVMSVAPVYYPCGKLITTDEYIGDDVLGFYYCDIDQSNLKAINLPKIYARKTEIENDWNYDGVLEDYLVSNVIIGLLKKFNCKVVIKNGFYFTEKKKSCDMFDFLLDFMKAKNEQDTLNKKKDDAYNPALRETLKLLMNSLSGKVIEGLHTEKTVDVNSIAEYEKIKQKF